ncbi:MAG: hypothetical protein GSR72_01700 [Desulfurococcales archaeon]|nr:hypothetical protein [Desulfurococcales archaeon]MEB3788589.1 hypothetical protein [Desulfurococcales archaeon]
MLHKLNKRELVAYTLLCKHKKINYGDAIDLLASELVMTKRTASNILRRLKRLGLIKVKIEDTGIIVEAEDIWRILNDMLERYKTERHRRAHALAKKKIS